MKEADAKLKWCPMARVTVTPEGPPWYGYMLTNRGITPADPTDTLCIGSACMMWEAYYKIENGQYVKENGEFVLSDNGDCGLKSKDLECNQ